MGFSFLVLNISENLFTLTLGACVFFASVCRESQRDKTESESN